MVAVAIVATIAADEGMSGGRETGSKNINRKRVPVIKIFQNLGAKYIRKAYRMQERSFWILLELIEPHMTTSKRGREGKHPMEWSILLHNYRWHYAGLPGGNQSI